MNITPFANTAAFRLEEYTDEKAGAVLRLVPICPDGTADLMRTEQFTGKTFIQTARGPQEVRFPIQASSLAEAFEKWTPTLMEVLKDMESAAVKQRIINGAAISPAQARALAKKQ